MQPRKMMGFTSPGDQRVPIPVRDWNGLKLALWRSKVAWGIVEGQAEEILGRCEHSDGCPAVHDETQPCVSECPDRELRMSALVILNAARMFASIDARRPASEPYIAPSREYFSEIVAELGAAQMELEVLRGMIRAVGLPLPDPPPHDAATPAPQLSIPQAEEST